MNHWVRRPQQLSMAEAVQEGACIGKEMLAPLYKAVVTQFEAYGDPFATVEYKKRAAGDLAATELWKALEGNAGKSGH